MNDTIGEKIRLRRLEKGYSQEYMGFMLEITQAAYSRMERNETTLTIPRIYEIAEILEVSPFTFLPKPKYGVGINGTFVQKTLAKLSRLWRENILARKEEAKKQNIQQRDISNTAP